jgi:hypothetical protein
LGYHAYSLTHNSTASIPTNSITNVHIDSTNITEFPVLNSSFSLNLPYNEPMEMKCRKCGEVSTLYYYYPDKENPAPFYTGMKITQDYKRVHINVKGYFVTFFKERIQTHYYMTRIVFNRMTGRVTVLQPLGEDDKPLKILPKYSKMWNVTYGIMDGRRDLRFINDGVQVMTDLRQQAIPYLLEALRKYFPYTKDDHFDECFAELIPEPVPQKKEPRLRNRTYNIKPPKRPVSEFRFINALRMIVRKFRFHDLPMPFLDSFENIHQTKMQNKLLGRIGYISKQQHSDLLKLAGPKIPKTIRKEVLKSVKVLAFVRNVKYVQSNSNMVKMIRRFSDLSFSASEFESFFHEYMNALILKHDAGFKNKNKLQEHCETVLVNRLVSEGDVYHIIDSYNQLQQIRDAGEDYVIDTDLSLRQLHDDLSSAVRKLRTKNKDLTYTEKEETIEWTYGKYAFKLAHDTHYLVDVGARMNICVGGYGDRAFNKSLHIVVVSSPDNPYECCIEMSHDMKFVCQAKTKHNFQPKNELLEAVMNWVNEKKLSIDTYDLPREEIIEEKRGFAVYPQAQLVQQVEAVHPEPGEIYFDDVI